MSRKFYCDQKAKFMYKSRLRKYIERRILECFFGVSMRYVKPSVQRYFMSPITIFGKTNTFVPEMTCSDEAKKVKHIHMEISSFC